MQIDITKQQEVMRLLMIIAILYHLFQNIHKLFIVLFFAVHSIVERCKLKHIWSIYAKTFVIFCYRDILISFSFISDVK